MGGQEFHQTGRIIKFILRRDRIRIPLWLGALFLLTLMTASAFTGLYQSPAEQQAMAETMKNPAMVAMVGPGYGLDNYTEGPMMAHQMLLFTAITVAIMNILLVTRHTRADEEEGRIELIRSFPVGRLSHMSATLIAMLCTNLLFVFAIGFGLTALGIESVDLLGSFTYGAAIGATGIFFAAVTLLFAQLSESSRGTIGFSFAILLVAYFIRAVGDVSNETLSMLSPLGWVLRTKAFVTNEWWPIVLTVGMSLIVLIVAMYLNAIRDIEAGFLPAKPGKKHASRFLRSTMGLPFRLQRTGIIAWAIGLYMLGVSYGSVLGDLEAFLANSEMMREMLQPVEGFSLTEQYITMLMSILAMMSTIPTLLFLLKLKGEEKRNRTEHLYSLALSRSRVLGSYFAIALASSIAMLFLAVLVYGPLLPLLWMILFRSPRFFKRVWFTCQPCGS